MNAASPSPSASQSLSIRGVDVQFPFTPYECQLTYMTAVIEALQTSRNALLESPTGTGKTLCLLCATLSWRESLRGEKAAKIDLLAEAKRREDMMAADETTTARRLMADVRLHQAELDVGKLPTIIYASRTHSQLHQVMGELKRTSFARSVRTTVLSSRQQTCRHDVVKQIESGIALKMGCKSLVSKRACKFYNNTDQYLLDHNHGDGEEEGGATATATAKKTTGAASQVLDIEDLIKIGDHKTVCPYYVSRGMVSKADVIFLPYNYLIDPKTRAGLGIDWNDAVVIFDEAHNIESVCSGTASFDLPITVIAGSVVELGTAVEIMQSGMGDGTDNASKQDRKHVTNMRGMQLVLKKLEDIISSYDNSVTKPGEFIVELFRDLRLTDETWQTFEGVIDVAIDVLTEDAIESAVVSRITTTRLSTLRDCLGKVFSKTTRVDERDFSGYRVHIHKEKQEAIGYGIEGIMLPTLSFWCFDPGEGMEALREGNMNIRSILLTSGTLSPMSSFALELRTDFPIRLENPHVIDNKKQVWIGVVPKGPAGVTLNSSFKTRSDAGYLTDLGNSVLNFARVIPDGILVFFPSYAVMGQCIEDWKSKGIWERLGQYKGLVVEPNNSAAFATAALEYKKKLDAPQYNGAAFFGVCRGKASEGLDFSDRAGRAVIICGIPFANAVDPKVKLKKEVLNSKLAAARGNSNSSANTNTNAHKQPGRKLPENTDANTGGGSGAYDGIFNTNNAADRISGDTWYVQQAMRAVNQAIGRVIRHKDDFGAIILCEERFGQSRHVAQLSKWLREDVASPGSFGEATKSIGEFFRSHRGSGGGGYNAISRTRAPKKRTDAFAQVGTSLAAEQEERSALGPAAGIGRPPDLPISMPNMLMPRMNSTQSSSSIDSLLAGNGKGNDAGPSSAMATAGLGVKGLSGNSTMHNNKPWLVHERQESQRRAKARSLGLSVAKVPRPMPQTRVGPVRPIKRHDVGNLKASLAEDAERPMKRKIASAPATASAPPTASAESLVASLKSKLGDAGFNDISKALKAYSSDKQIAPLIEEAARLLHAHDALADLFRDRIPPEHRPAYDARIQRERRLRMVD